MDGREISEANDKASKRTNSTQPSKQMADKVPTEVRRPSSKRQFKQQRQKSQSQRPLKTNLQSTYESRENLDSFRFSNTVRNVSNTM